MGKYFMKSDIKKLYKKDKKLAIQVAKVLGYKIIISKSKKTLDVVVNDIVDYLSKTDFNYINRVANNEGYRLKLTVKDFEKYLRNMLVGKLKIK